MALILLLALVSPAAQSEQRFTDIGDAFIVPSFDISGCRALPVRTIE